ncbi:DNA repair protein RAD5B [Diospyros lotus]|uniref:DNA repair protein RAD5B n=1 Tax=Diospyros lotus TaxID=55363 RepID=UPI00224F4E89|nr:DNA repair protein RAD5B [Diospyros lotus]
MENDTVGGEHEAVKTIRSMLGAQLGPQLSESDVLGALTRCGNDALAAVKFLLDSPGLSSPPATVKRTVTSTGARVSAPIKQDKDDGGLEDVDKDDEVKPKNIVSVKEEPDLGVKGSDCVQKSIIPGRVRMSYDEFLRATNNVVMADGEYLRAQMIDRRGQATPVSGLKGDLKGKEEIDVDIEEAVSVKRVKDSGDLESSEPLIRRGMTFNDRPRLTWKPDGSEAKSGETISVSALKGDLKGKEEIDVDIEEAVSVKRVEESGDLESSEPLFRRSMTFNDRPRLTWKPDGSEAKSGETISVSGLKGDLKGKQEIDVDIEEKLPLQMEVEDSGKPDDSEAKSSPGTKAEIRIEDKSIVVFQNEPSLEEGTGANYESPTRPSYLNLKKGRVGGRELSALVIEDGDFPKELDWLLVERTVITGISTTRGRKLENNEIVHFTFPSAESRRRSSHWMSAKAAAAVAEIVRFSTKRYGEIGRLPMEWAKCLIPLVNSSKVKVLGRCIAAPLNLHLMQDIMLYVSFYIHRSVLTEGVKSSWKLDSPSNIDSTIHPLLTLFKLLKIKPFQKAEFTPEELDSRKRSLNLEADSDDAEAMLPIVKRRKGSQQCVEQNKDEQAISESSLNKIVGAADVYNLQEIEAPETLMCDLRPYQKQALYWMSESEKGVDVEEAAKTLHPCWAAYRICDERCSAIYVNIFSGEATTQFPTAMMMARGGILADAMGLGKTVMTIALILARPGRGSLDNQKLVLGATDNKESKEKEDSDNVQPKVKGNTLIICPMALLSQWRDEHETHSKPGTISIFVHYGGDRANDPKVMAQHDVVLTTYGVLTAAYKTDGENSIFHKVEWYRVVLDEAHIIKSSRTLGAQAAFTLSSHCRWCLSGTPIQNNLEDLYSLLCFLHVEPWCNWAWWSKLIQRPYENGDQRGLKLIKAILRPLMLRRTKETKDKEGRPILLLPPTDVQVIECEQSEAEHDFYNALFKRSKVQFDQFVAQGKVLHNYANILELLLRLRQCCNHPFLVMSRNTQEYADLNKLARRFLESNIDSATLNDRVPSRAYVEEVVEGIRKGDNTECPICLESADDPVFTPCAHRMCRECLLSSWRTPSAGLCPICRQLLKHSDLITCPSESKFRVDVEKNWNESSKVSKLLEFLEKIRRSGSGEKSIVFSQWTSFLDLLEIPLRRRRIGFLRFDGKLVQKHRERVLKEFNETSEKMVLLMSLKAGGVGLNLTAASNVFLMDPWWNPAVEEQAIMRIHRIGQKRTVRVKRFIVKDTVEERMQQVQTRKQRMIAGALTDEEVRSARIEELKMLFR